MQVNPCTTKISLGLGENLQNLTCTYRTATLADCETQTFVECNRVEVCDRVIYLKDGKVEWNLAIKEFMQFSSAQRKEFGLRTMENVAEKIE